MTRRGRAFIVGAYEHPLRDIPDRSVAEVHAEVAAGALADAGLTFADVDAYYCAGDAPGFGAIARFSIPKIAACPAPFAA